MEEGLGNTITHWFFHLRQNGGGFGEYRTFLRLQSLLVSLFETKVGQEVGLWGVFEQKSLLVSLFATKVGQKVGLRAGIHVSF